MKHSEAKSLIRSLILEVKAGDKVDSITMDIPLFLRMLEYAREDAKDDMDLHNVTQRANKLTKHLGTLTMDNYSEITKKY